MAASSPMAGWCRRGCRCWSRCIAARTRSNRSASGEAAPEHLLDGARRHADARHQRHRHRAVGHPGQATGQPVGRCWAASIATACSPYCSLLMEEPAAMARCGGGVSRAGFRAPSRSAGVRSAGAMIRRWTRPSCARRGRPPGRSQPVRRCRRQRRVLAAGSEMGDAHGGDAGGLRVGWFEEPLRPDAIDDYLRLAPGSPVPIAGGEVLTRRQTFLPWLARRLRYRAARRDQGGRHQRAAAHRLDGR